MTRWARVARGTVAAKISPFMNRTSAMNNAGGVALFLAFAMAGVVAFAAPASAHNYYVSSTPEIDSVLTSLPEEFVVTTSDKLLELGGMEGGFFMQVTGPDGLYYGDGCVTVSGPSVSMTTAVGPAGKYSLDWQVVSADGHTISGQIPFSWQPSSPSKTPSTGSSTPPRCGEATAPPATDAAEVPVTQTPTVADDVATSDTDILWIAGGIGAIVVAAIAAVMLIRPKKRI